MSTLRRLGERNDDSSLKTLPVNESLRQTIEKVDIVQIIIHEDRNGRDLVAPHDQTIVGAHRMRNASQSGVADQNRRHTYCSVDITLVTRYM